MKNKEVMVLQPLTHPFIGPRCQLMPGKYNKEILIHNLGKINYEYAVKEKWIKEIK